MSTLAEVAGDFFSLPAVEQFSHQPIQEFAEPSDLILAAITGTASPIQNSDGPEASSELALTTFGRGLYNPPPNTEVTVKTLLVPAVLLVLSGISTAQPPAAPAPRPVEPAIANLTFTYHGPDAPKSPRLEMSSKDGKVEVRWQMQGEPCLVIATRAVVNGDVVSFAGTEKEPVVMSVARAQGGTMLTGMYIDVVLSEGKIKVTGAGNLKLPK